MLSSSLNVGGLAILFFKNAVLQINIVEQNNILSDSIEIIVRIATADDTHYAEQIVEEMFLSAQARGTGIAKRTPDYVAHKMEEGKAVIAHDQYGNWAGFC